MLADHGAAGEGELADHRARQQVPADFVGHAEHRLRDLFRQPGVEQRLENAERARRGFLGALEDHRAARGDRRAELAAGIAEREVPRRESGDRANRLVPHRRAHAGGADQLAAVEAEDLAGVEVEQADDHHHFEAGFGERLALLHRGDAGEIVGALDQQTGSALQHGGALLRRGLAPDAEALGRDFERAVEIGRLGQRQRADRLAGDRVHDIERPPAAAGDLLAVDDHVEGRVLGH